MKPRRDITLGEMQDECKKYSGDPQCKDCPYESWCGASSPDGWDLSDPPRFDEKQTKVLHDLYTIGARIVETQYSTFMIWKSVTKESDSFLGSLVSKAFGLENITNETLDLAELLGKESNEK